MERSLRTRALIAGASGGIGRDMARVLAAMDVDSILVTRRGDRLRGLKRELAASIDTIILDVSVKENCLTLYQRFHNDSADMLINNTGSGDFGEFILTGLDKELNTISTNIQAVHIPSKLFLWDFVRKDRGYTPNVVSSTAFLPGPLMITRYAIEVYVERLTSATHRRLQKRSNYISVSVLCPGLVQTESDHVTNVRFIMKGETSMDIASYTICGIFKEEAATIPGILIKGSYLLCRYLPLSVQMGAPYHIQYRKDR